MTTSKPVTSREALQSLIRSVGGEVRLRELMIRFYKAMAQDLLIGFFFEGRDPVSVAEKQSSFLLHLAGIGSNPEGRGPATAHQALPPILNGHFDRRLRILETVLHESGLPEPVIRIWVNFEESFRKVVVAPSEPGT